MIRPRECTLESAGLLTNNPNGVNPSESIQRPNTCDQDTLTEMNSLRSRRADGPLRRHLPNGRLLAATTQNWNQNSTLAITTAIL